MKLLISPWETFDFPLKGIFQREFKGILLGKIPLEFPLKGVSRVILRGNIVILKGFLRNTCKKSSRNTRVSLWVPLKLPQREVKGVSRTLNGWVDIVLNHTSANWRCRTPFNKRNYTRDFLGWKIPKSVENAVAGEIAVEGSKSGWFCGWKCGWYYFWKCGSKSFEGLKNGSKREVKLIFLKWNNVTNNITVILNPWVNFS